MPKGRAYTLTAVVREFERAKAAYDAVAKQDNELLAAQKGLVRAQERLDRVNAKQASSEDVEARLVAAKAAMDEALGAGDLVTHEDDDAASA